MELPREGERSQVFEYALVIFIVFIVIITVIIIIGPPVGNIAIASYGSL